MCFTPSKAVDCGLPSSCLLVFFPASREWERPAWESDAPEAGLGWGEEERGERRPGNANGPCFQEGEGKGRGLEAGSSLPEAWTRQPISLFPLISCRHPKKHHPCSQGLGVSTASGYYGCPCGMLELHSPARTSGPGATLATSQVQKHLAWCMVISHCALPHWSDTPVPHSKDWRQGYGSYRGLECPCSGETK